MAFIPRLMFFLALSCTLSFSQSSWNPQVSGTTANLRSVVWGPSTGSETGQLVAVGDSGIILTSPDGVNWTRQVSGTTALLTSVIWGGNQWVAVGSGGSARNVLTSTDGITWTVQVSAATGALFSVAWTGDQYVGVGQSNPNLPGISLSPDAATWAPGPANLGGQTLYSLSSVIWDGSKLVAVGGMGTSIIATSPDGLTWTRINAPPVIGPGTFSSVAYSGSQYVATNTTTAGTSKGLLISSDAVTWSIPALSSTARPLLSVVWTGSGSTPGQWVAVGTGGAVLTSMDGGVWVPQTMGTSFTAYSVTSFGTQLVAVGSGGNIMLASQDPLPALPEVPHLVEPAEGDMGVDLNTPLGWDTAVGAIFYRVQLSTSPEFDSLIVKDSVFTGTSRSLTNLKYGTTYYWRVCSRNSAGSSAFATSSFTTPELPPPSNLKYPVDSMAFSDALYGPQTPSVTGTVTQWSISPALPTQMTFNTSTGVLSGYPTSLFPWMEFTITASNSGGSTATQIWIASFGGLAVHADFYPQKLRLENRGKVVSFHLARPSQVSIRLYNSKGEVTKLLEGLQPSGDYRLPLRDAKRSGALWLDFSSDGFHKTIPVQ